LTNKRSTTSSMLMQLNGVY